MHREVLPCCFLKWKASPCWLQPQGLPAAHALLPQSLCSTSVLSSIPSLSGWKTPMKTYSQRLPSSPAFSKGFCKIDENLSPVKHVWVLLQLSHLFCVTVHFSLPKCNELHFLVAVSFKGILLQQFSTVSFIYKHIWMPLPSHTPCDKAM